jgi:hypothetical protein
MEVVRELMRRPDSSEMLAVGFFAVAAILAIFRGELHTVLVGVAFAMIVLGALPKQKMLAFLVGASAIVLVQIRTRQEGFEDVSGAKDQMDQKEKEKEKEADTPAVDASAGDMSGNETHDASGNKKNKTEGFSAPITGGVLVPDNATRKEPLVLGQPYKLPSEKDDAGYHLDAGTTFLNAYKALKPDQIAAMTRDTQELLSTQKSLVAMLDSFGPLLKDMNKITGFFGGSQ